MVAAAAVEPSLSRVRESEVGGGGEGALSNPAGEEDTPWDHSEASTGIHISNTCCSNLVMGVSIAVLFCRSISIASAGAASFFCFPTCPDDPALQSSF